MSVPPDRPEGYRKFPREYIIIVDWMGDWFQFLNGCLADLDREMETVMARLKAIEERIGRLERWR